MSEQIKQTTTGYTYTNTVPVGYTSKNMSIQPPPQPTPPLLEPPPAISMPLNKPTTPPNKLSVDQLLPTPATPSKEARAMSKEARATSKAEPNTSQEVPLTARPRDTKLLLRRSPWRAGSNTSHSRRNTLSMSRWRKFIKFLMRWKSSSMRKSLETKGSQLRRPSLITMPLRLRSSTSADKSKRQSWLRSLLRESTKEFNTSQLKLKSFTTPRETTTSQPRLK